MRLMLKGQEFHNYFFGQERKRGKFITWRWLMQALLQRAARLDDKDWVLVGLKNPTHS